MSQYANHERFLINLSVEQFEFASRCRAYAAHPDEAVKSRQHWPHSSERMRQLTELRAELDWLRAGCQTAQQQALRVVDQAYANWWKNPSHFRRPTFRSKFDAQGFDSPGPAITSTCDRSAPSGVKFACLRSDGSGSD
ncbi:IS element transposase [mine drainage metagenome]|uniref:IS element transposase n=1 Tax=mine drainage metagenome TaxID=410659 RepID=T0ZQB3_9ZZZZ